MLAPPAPLPLPPLSVQAGLPEGSQAFEAEGSRAGPPPQAGGSVGHRRNWGEGAKHLPQPWPRGKECSTAIEGSESKEKKETEDGGGRRSPAVHPAAFWELDWVAALASTWVPCFELLLARDGATTGFGTGGVMGRAGIFLVECRGSPTSGYVSVCVCACVCVSGGGGGRVISGVS